MSTNQTCGSLYKKKCLKEIVLIIIFVFTFQCSGLGASFCYLLSYLVGIRLVQKYIPERVAEWRVTVSIEITFTV